MEQKNACGFFELLNRIARDNIIVIAFASISTSIRNYSKLNFLEWTHIQSKLHFSLAFSLFLFSFEKK